MDRVQLKAGDSLLVLAPGIGGGIARLVLAGVETLRRAPEDGQGAKDPLQLGEFPMAPWVNRVANGRFTWEESEVGVAGGPGGDPQGLHGVSWRTCWSVLQESAAEVVLGMAWDGAAGWPFPFKFTRRFVLTQNELTIEARLENTGFRPMPAALGFHPYFPSAGARLRAAASAAWITDAAGLPVSLGLERMAADMRSGLKVEAQPLDHCFVGWDGIAVIDWPTHSMTMQTDPALTHLQVYSPTGAGHFCVEPQSAMPDAFNRDQASSGIRILAPERDLVARLRLKVSSADPGGMI